MVSFEIISILSQRVLSLFFLFLSTGVSDLELSSFVEKASMQMTERTFRMIPGKSNSSNSNNNNNNNNTSSPSNIYPDKAQRAKSG